MKRFMRSSRGFSLIEAAIVLGIIGLVLGGIWVAAATVRENMVASTVASDVLTMVTRIQEKYSKNDSVNMGVGDNISSLMNTAKVPPPNWTWDSSLDAGWGGFHAPYGGVLTFVSFPPGVAWDGFRINLLSLSQRLCIKVGNLIMQRMAIRSVREGIAFNSLQMTDDNDGNGNVTGYWDSASTSFMLTAVNCASTTNTNLLMFTFNYPRMN